MVGLPEVASVEVDSADVGPEEVGSSEVGPAEVGSVVVDSSEEASVAGVVTGPAEVGLLGVVVGSSVGAGVDSAGGADELSGGCTAGPTSGCLPDLGSVSRPQVVPAVLKLLP